MAEIQLTIKFSNADKHEVTALLSDTVLEFKQKIAEKISVPAGQQRLIYRGRVLKDEHTLESYEIQSGQTVHLVKGAATGSTPSSSSTTTNANTSAPPASASPNPFAAFGGLPGAGFGGAPDISRMQDQLMRNPDMMNQILNSPMMENFLNNPELIQNMMLNNPQMQTMLNANPHIRQILSDPAVIRQTMETLRNPNAMREAMRSQDLQMSRIENLPGGFNMLRQLYEEVQEPMIDAAHAMNQSQRSSFPAPGGGSTAPSSSAPNNSALPNPWASSSGSQPAPGTLPGMGTGGFPGMPGGGAGFGGMRGMPPVDPSQLSAMMADPRFAAMYTQMMSDPAMLQQMSAMDPQFAQMMQNPQMRAMMANPDFIRQLSNPANLQAMMQMQQAMQTLQRNGFPGIPGVGGLGAAPAVPPVGGLDFSALLGAGSGAGTGNAFRPAAPPVSDPPRVRYAAQLQQLQAMGFSDDEASLVALAATSGNVNAAVERLLG